MEKGLSSSSSSGGGADSFNGLNFGKKVYFEGMSSGLHPKIGGEEEAAPPRSPAKKGRTGVAHGGQPPLCQVEGCKIDLSGAKAYYCRHKVCGQHSKSPMVIVAGLQQRFCQQCSRFHQLPEFDQDKRSCRRRLAGHNERRRKPPPGPLLSSRYAALSPSLYDNHIKTGGLSATDNHTNCQLPWQSSSQPPLPLLLQGSATRPSYSDEDCFTGIPESSSALSLLSNWGSTTQPLDLGVNNFLETNASAMAQPSLHGTWDFKDDDNCIPDMGLQQSLELAQPVDGVHQTEGYDCSVHYMNWSL